MSKSAPGVLRGDPDDPLLAIQMTRGENCRSCSVGDCSGCPAIHTITGIHNVEPVHTKRTTAQ